MYVSRDNQGLINGVFLCPQPGSAEEELPDDHADVVAYISPPVDLHAYAAEKRWQKESGGITVGMLSIPTDARTQRVVTGAYVKASLNPAFSIPNWKVATGVYVTLDAATIIAFGDAITAHVQACFDLNASVDASIETGTITTTTEIDAAFA